MKTVKALWMLLLEASNCRYTVPTTDGEVDVERIAGYGVYPAGRVPELLFGEDTVTFSPAGAPEIEISVRGNMWWAKMSVPHYCGTCDKCKNRIAHTARKERVRLGFSDSMW